MVPAERLTKIALVYNTSSYLYRFRKELVESLRDSGYSVLAVVPDLELKPKLEALGVECIDYRLSARGLNPVLDLLACYDLVRAFKKHRPEIVLNFTIKPVLYGSLSARLAGVERIYSMIPGRGHVFSDKDALRRALRTAVIGAYKIALSTNHRVFFQNREDKTFFVESGLVKEEQAIRINGSGVNLEDFHPDAAPAGANSFILISRIFEEKGVRQFVEAARDLKKEHGSAEFQIVGPIQPGEGISEEEMADWVQEGVIDYLGEVDDVRPLLRRSAVFVLPSYYREGVPRSILEALAMGKPVITTDWPGCRETVTDGENGYLVPVRDAAALTDAMRRLMDAPDLVGRMGRASREKAIENYDVRTVNGKVMAALASGARR